MNDLFQKWFEWERSPQRVFEKEAARWWVSTVCKEHNLSTQPLHKMSWIDETCGSVSPIYPDGWLMAALDFPSKFNYQDIMPLFRELCPMKGSNYEVALAGGAKIVALYRNHLDQITQPCLVVGGG